MKPGIPWSVDELVLLWRLRCVEALDFATIAARLGRGEISVQSQARAFKFSLPRERIVQIRREVALRRRAA